MWNNYNYRYYQRAGRTDVPAKELVLTAVYGFGVESMLLLSNLKMWEKKRLCHIIAKVYLLRWRIEEYFRFKKQQFGLEDSRVMSLPSIRNLNLLAALAVGNIGLTTAVHKDSIFLAEIKECGTCPVHVPVWYQRFPATESQITTDPPV